MSSPRKPDEAFDDRLRDDLHRLVADRRPSPLLRQRVEQRGSTGPHAWLNRKGLLAVAASVAVLTVAASMVASGRSPDAEVYAGQGQSPPVSTPSADGPSLAPKPGPDPFALDSAELPSSVPEEVEPGAPDPAPEAVQPPVTDPGEVVAEEPPPPVAPPPNVPGVARIAYVSSTDGPKDIHLVNEDGSGQMQLTYFGTTFSAEGPAWSPDGDRIAFTGVSDLTGTDIYVINADGTGQVRLTDFQGADAWPAWSPDGTRIAFYRGEMDGSSGIWVMNSDGTGLERLADFGDYPTWSPDGTTIAFSSNNGGRGVFLMNADGSDQRQLTTNDYALGPDWSPDGQKIAFQSGGLSATNQSGSITVVNADGTDERVITTAVYYFGPSWSPDSASLGIAENCSLYLVSGDGTSREKLSTAGSCAEDPAWTA